MIKIAIICDTSGKDDEGMKKVSRNLANTINKRGGFEVNTINTKECIKYFYNYDILHFIGGPTIRTILAAFFCKIFKWNLKTILTFTNPFLSNLSIQLLGLLKPSISLVSSYYWLNLLRKINVNVKMFNISGVDTQKFFKVSKDKKIELRLKWNIPLNKVVALHVGHLKKDRNISSLINLQKDPEVQVLVVGSTTTKRSDEEVQSLENAGSIVISDYIPSIEEIYQLSDCYIFPTIDQKAAIQIPLSILEAISSGIPVVSTEFGGLKDVLENSFPIIKFIKEKELEELNIIMKNHLNSIEGNIFEINKLDWNYISNDLIKLYEK